MNEIIAHSNDGGPWYSWIRYLNCIGNMIGRFAYYLQTPHNIALLVFVGKEHLAGYAIHRPADALYRLQHMIKPLRILRCFNIRHSAIMSFRTTYAK